MTAGGLPAALLSRVHRNVCVLIVWTDDRSGIVTLLGYALFLYPPSPPLHFLADSIKYVCTFISVTECSDISSLNAYNNVKDILYNTDVITNIVKSIVHSPVEKLV